MISTAATAQVRKATEYQLCFKDCPLQLDLKSHFIIDRRTLKLLNKDAKAKDIAYTKLLQLQTELNTLSDRYNSALGSNYALRLEVKEKDKKVYELSAKVYKLSRTPWYKHPVFWLSVGLAIGATGTAIVIAAVR